MLWSRYQTIGDLYLSHLVPQITTASAAWSEVVDEAVQAFTEGQA